MNNTSSCLSNTEIQPFEPQAEDILTDEDLLDLFRIVKQVLRKNPDSEKLAKLLFCMSYALGDHIKFSKPCHEDRIVFRDTNHSAVVHAVRLPSTSSCCRQTSTTAESIISSSSTSSSHHSPLSPLNRLPSVSHLTHPSPIHHDVLTDSLRPYTSFRSPSIASITSSTVIPSSPPVITQQQQQQQQQHVVDMPDLMTEHRPSIQPTRTEIVMEPQQRGFYYQDGRIAREPVLLQRYAEQGILTQASLMRKRKRQSVDANAPFHELSNIPTPTKKPKIPHRHGEFESRRDDIIHRLRSITMADLEQKAQRLPQQFTLAIDESATLHEESLSATVASGSLSKEQLGELLAPALRILTNHSNMKPHLDNGMNQNGIYYNSDYFRLYLAFEQFQRTFAILFPNEIVKMTDMEDDKDKDRERNANMKAYRPWIEPLLTETNWAAFRRNIVVGERMMQLTKSVGQGVLLMTKELSGSKLHLTFTNSEWDEFIQGLNSGKWDQTVEFDQKAPPHQKSMLVAELQVKFMTQYWFYPEGLLVSPKERRMLIHASTVNNGFVVT